MPGLTIAFGLILIVLGVAAYFGSGRASPTALIPSFVGALLLVCGVVARSPGARKHAMHGAAAVGLLGFLAAAGRLGMAFARGTAPTGWALASLALMALLCLVFVLLCVRSFVEARRSRAGFDVSPPGRA